MINSLSLILGMTFSSSISSIPAIPVYGCNKTAYRSSFYTLFPHLVCLQNNHAIVVITCCRYWNLNYGLPHACA